MTEPVLPSQEARRPAVSTSQGELRSAATRPCPSCSAQVSVNASLCPACGESLPARNKRIRCRRCGGSAPSALVVCPHCGRDLHAAPPRFLTWGAPLLLVAFFGAALLMQPGGANPLAWGQRQTERVVALVGEISDRLQPDFSITTIAADDDSDDQLVSQPPAPPAPALALAGATLMPGEESDAAFGDAATPGQADAAVTSPPTAETANVTAEALPTSTMAPSPTPEPTATSAPTATPAAPTPTHTALPTVTALPTATATEARPTSSATAVPPAAPTAAVRAATPTAAGRTTTLAVTATATAPAPQVALALPTPTPVLATPTSAPPTPVVYRVRPGDTLFELALNNDISLEALLAANNLTEDDVFTLQPGDEIIIPDANATVAPTPTVPPEGFTYTVRAGDTLMAIGLRYGVNTQRILDANGLTLAQARTLRPGQTLLIPGITSGSTTPTALPATATPAPLVTATPAASESRLDAPQLRSPENGASVKCGTGEQLAWTAVAFIQASDVYIAHLGYVNGRDSSGVEQIVWVLAQQRPANVTLWQLDDSLCGLAPFEFGRQWRWYVEVAEKAADGTLKPVSPPSEMWGFTWQ